MLACQKIFISRGLTLAVAESLTGGALSHALTRVSGASAYFLGSVVAYSNLAKSKVLSVPEGLIHDKGAVSQEVALAMARGVQQLLGADIGVSLTGIAGPLGGSPEIPVGTYWACIVAGNKEHIWTKKVSGTREMVIESAVNDMLSSLEYLSVSDE